MSELTELERLEKNVVETKAVADAAEEDYWAYEEASAVADEAYAVARKELKDYRNYKKAQLIQQLAEIVMRHDMETT